MNVPAFRVRCFAAVRSAFTVAILVLSAVALRAQASSFTPMVDPGGNNIFSHWEQASLRPEPDKCPLFDAQGKPTVIGAYLDALARDPRHLRTHLRFVMSDASGNWEQIDAPRYRGSAMNNQSAIHRMLRAVGQYTKLVATSDLPADRKAGLMTDAWRDAAEEAFGELINDGGLLALGSNTCDMAQAFHLLRTGLASARLRPERIWTLPRAQRLVRTLLTAPHILNPVDAWLPAAPAYLAQCREQNRKTPDDPIKINGDRVFFTGGLFIGWKPARPSLHGTWDGLSILNTLYSLYPEPDATKAASIFFLWNQEPAEKKVFIATAMATLRQRLWTDWRDRCGATYCYVADGKPADTTSVPSAPSEAPLLRDHAGYPLAEFWHWAALSHAEMFGQPTRNSNAGVQRLLALVSLPVARD